MAEGYRLDLSGLGRLVDQLAHAEDRMNSANDSLRNAGVHDLGSRDIDHAGAAFQDRWEYGTGKLAKAASKMVDGLDATKKQYNDAETNIAQYFPAAEAAPAAPATPAGTDSAIGRRMAGSA
ncbi:hypothetical protein [Actinocrispum wychmicini]|uniref:Excreted virulence factor EspC (Type VII ESX diderm) n=1 Tax=Actinocrispum wychmicini TaxID=1213861 RepID=A0A4R2J341_9PSEU|nr:hypothetical protein [Actinocrispum wychmicini]TCO52813.1 hypothetical protein EV192_1117 [Actinocrispum wychmicini]